MEKNFLLVLFFVVIFLLILSLQNNDDYLIQTNLLDFKKKNYSLQLSVSIQNNSKKPIYVSSDPFSIFSFDIHEEKLIFNSNFWIPDNTMPDTIMCPKQIKVDPLKNTILIFNVDLKDEIKYKSSASISADYKLNLNKLQRWFQRTDSNQTVEITFMYFTKEITLEMIRAGYKENFNNLMKKYGKHIVAKQLPPLK